MAGAGFVRQVEARACEHEDVVLEITERVPVEERQPYRAASCATSSAQGFGIAIDDMGAGYSSLPRWWTMEPDYLKFDIALVRGIDRSLDQAQPAGDAGRPVREDRGAGDRGGHRGGGRS